VTTQGKRKTRVYESTGTAAAVIAARASLATMAGMASTCRSATGGGGANGQPQPQPQPLTGLTHNSPPGLYTELRNGPKL